MAILAVPDSISNKHLFGPKVLIQWEIILDQKPKPKILIVEDEPASLNLLASYFETEGYDTHKAASGEAAETILSNHKIDVVLLDVNLPGMDGFTLLKEIKTNSSPGVIFVTSKKDDIDRIVGLELGADDYVTKPYNPRELLVRVRNLISRLGAQRPSEAPRVVAFGDMQLHMGRRVIKYADGSQSQLTDGEFKLLRALIERAGQVLSRDMIMNEMDGRDWFPNDRTIDVLIARVRKKLGDSRESSNFINTAHGAGYIFVGDVTTVEEQE